MTSKIEVAALYEGTFSVGTDKKFHRINKNDSPQNGSLKLSVNPFLIKDGSHNILFDAGIGDLYGSDTSIRTIRDNLSEYSLSDYDITDIFISHLHFDHMAGLANRQNGFWELTFPDASVWVSEEGWNRLKKTIHENSEDEIELFYFLDLKADLHFLSEEDNPIPHVRVQQIGGHTKYHYALFYENKDAKYLMAGDVIGTKNAINRSYKAKYDEDPDEGMKRRNELQKLAFENNYIIMAYHETHSPLFRLVLFDENKGYKIENIPDEKS